MADTIIPDSIGPADSSINPPISNFQDFQKLKPRLTKLISNFGSEITATKARREIRNVDFSVEVARKAGSLDETDTFIPIRVVDTNIRREQPPFVAYLKQSRRLMTFVDVKNPSANTTDLENEFTRGMTYLKWELPHFKSRDGSQTHGWAAVEVVFDISKPFHVGIDYIAHEDLIFPTDCEDFQANEVVLRAFHISPLKLESFVIEYGFNPVQVKTILDTREDSRRDDPVCIYKCFYKENGIVYVGWFENQMTSDWLKKPEKLFLGIQRQNIIPGIPDDLIFGAITPPTITIEDIPVTDYPIFLLPYFETEQKKIVDYKGRVFLDKHKQEAMTAGWSSFLSAQLKAAEVLVALERSNLGSTNDAKIQSLKYGHGRVIAEAAKFFHLDYPDPSMLNALQALDVQNSQETGQMTFAVQNKKGSRTTATEIQAAKEDTALLNSVQVTLYSIHIREVYTLVWTIVQSQAMLDKIRFLFDEILGMNRKDIIGREYQLFAAGDTDVIRRNELLEEYRQLLPLTQGTPIYEEILAEIVRLTLSEKGSLYADKIRAGSPANIIASLVTTLKGAISPEEQKVLGPDEINNLKMIIGNATNYLAKLGINLDLGSKENPNASIEVNQQ